MKITLNFLFAFAIALPFVAAHGLIRSITVDGTKFMGPAMNQGSPIRSAIRQVDSQDPIKGATNPDIICGRHAKAAPDVIPARPGSLLEFDWKGADGRSLWPHRLGPMSTWLAECSQAGCANTDASTVRWFKFQETGPRLDGTWLQGELMKGLPATARLPENLHSGQFLVRHDIIALHLAEELGGAEFYGGCGQIEVSGNQTGFPREEDLFTIPGIYKDDDSGILVNVFDPGFVTKYNIPGPPVATLVQNLTPTGTATTAEPTITNLSKSGSGQKSCGGPSCRH